MVGVAVVGAGAWGKNHIRVFSEIPKVRLKYICDQDPSKLVSVLKSFPQTPGMNCLDPILEDPEVQGVVIASSAVSHASLAKAALAADKDVLVEKPMALNPKDAEEMLALAEERKRILMVGHLLIYHPAVDRLKEMVASGELGKIHYIYTQRVNLGIIRQDENALWSFAPHDLSVILHLLGEDPTVVSAHGESYIQKGIADVVFVSLRFPDGMMANIHLSWLDPHKLRKVTIVGSKKMVVFDDMEASEKLKIYDKGVGSPSYATYGEYLTLRFGDITIPSIKMKEPLRAEAEHFIECMETRKEPKTGGRDGLKVVNLLVAAQKSLEKKGAPVMIREKRGQ
ncbi:MAG: gfo/Idh/MocA family oxidoreductase [Deltaproteobacteria bacterium]|nr:MAG: gfo/Idh/MocA family oxidoreductase [Deltaproteobacteria bacterium]